jgi:hypothetical protein
MTERKPPGVPFETWVDKQIREAEQRGDFAELPGAGKPLPSLDTPYDELWWIKGKMHREGLSALPATLVLRKEAEDALAAVAGARSERQVREILTGVNDKIREALRRPPEGPPLNLGLFDVERVVEDWREEQRVRQTAGARDEPGGEQPGPAPRRTGIGRLFRRSRSA